MTSVVRESPAARFARRQAERDAAKALERLRIREKAAAEPIHHKGEPLPEMYPKSDQLARLCGLLDAGSSVSEAARVVGCTRLAARKAYRAFVAERARSGRSLPMCPCGRPATHRGWCRPRFQKNPARQQVMAALHNRQRAGGGLATWERVP